MTSFMNEGVVDRRRRFVLLMAAIYSALTAGAAALVLLALYNIFSGSTGYVVMLTVFGLLVAVTGYWMFAYLRDARAEPIAIEGEIVRKWVRGRVLELFFPSCYVTVDGRIFVISRFDYASLLETDLVRVRCYPHSLTVEYIERYDEVRKQFVPTDGVAVR